MRSGLAAEPFARKSVAGREREKKKRLTEASGEIQIRLSTVHPVASGLTCGVAGGLAAGVLESVAILLLVFRSVGAECDRVTSGFPDRLRV